MSRVEEMEAVRATPAQAIATLLDPARMNEWSAPGISVDVGRPTQRLMPGDRFRVQTVTGPAFEYQVEAVTQREVVLRFAGPWSGEERWSFVADGEETIVRRTYTVEDAGGLLGLAWRVLGQALVIGSFKLELGRFREVVERLPAIRAEIEPATRRDAPGRGGDTGSGSAPPGGERAPRGFTIDEG